jgi:hypothetical protein
LSDALQELSRGFVHAPGFPPEAAGKDLPFRKILVSSGQPSGFPANDINAHPSVMPFLSSGFPSECEKRRRIKNFRSSCRSLVFWKMKGLAARPPVYGVSRASPAEDGQSDPPDSRENSCLPGFQSSPLQMVLSDSILHGEVVTHELHFRDAPDEVKL